MNANEIVREARDMATYDCGFECDDCFKWRGLQEAKKGATE